MSAGPLPGSVRPRRGTHLRASRLGNDQARAVRSERLETDTSVPHQPSPVLRPARRSVAMSVAPGSESYQDRWYLHCALMVASTAGGEHEAALEHAQAADSFWPGYEYPRIGLAAVRARDWEVVAEVPRTLDQRPSLDPRTASWVKTVRGPQPWRPAT